MINRINYLLELVKKCGLQIKRQRNIKYLRNSLEKAINCINCAAEKTLKGWYGNMKYS